jgi:arabinose-5-phosphate isomerase
MDIESDSILQIRDKLNSDFITAIALLENCQGKVIVSGLGKSGLVGRKIASTLASTGTPAIFLHPAEGAHGDLGVVMRGDVAMLISNSGETDETLEIIPSIKRIDVPILALCGRPESNLAKVSDVVIDVGVDREACPNNLAPTASTTALLALGDAFAIVLLKKRGFRKEDFAVLHTGGTIGKRLLLKVGDIQQHINDIPIVNVATKMENAIIEMTSKPMGAVCVVDDSGLLAGILTDGDLRRAIKRFHGNLFTVPVSEVMTCNPTTIHEDCLAVKATQLMEDRPSQISVLPVISKDKRPVGLVRIHDLVRAGVY